MRYNPVGELDWREQITRIDRAIAETGKLMAEQSKFNAEQAKMIAEQTKLAAETRKFNRDPLLASLTVFGTVFGAVLAAIIARLPEILRALGWAA